MNPGKIMIMINRQRNYLAFLNSFMIMYLFIQEAGLHWWYFLVLVFLAAWTIIDIRYIHPKEINYNFSKSDILNKLVRENEE